ncbi:hypothetical protein [Bradyrhizobium sp. dw_78]|uniref:hypothetical protein n=1 Tax=Bradyrhizobium sp. dw_78 TaxID=2719793 RepID=UPI00201BF464|nr:hypothetical protein [Bradyrhizobium sp. dw_78]
MRRDVVGCIRFEGPGQDDLDSRRSALRSLLVDRIDAVGQLVTCGFGALSCLSQRDLLVRPETHLTHLAVSRILEQPRPGDVAGIRPFRNLQIKAAAIGVSAGSPVFWLAGNRCSAEFYEHDQKISAQNSATLPGLRKMLNGYRQG